MSVTGKTKDDLRRALRACRRKVSAERAGQAADDVKRSLLRLHAAGVLPGPVVAGYAARGSELDVLPALAALRQAGYVTALPVVDEDSGSLRFHAFESDADLMPGLFSIRVPRQGQPVAVDCVLVPLLGFDRRGHRLGYGKGHYDRTLQALRTAARPVLAVGVAYVEQLVLPALPAEAHDQRLDCILTDRRLYWPEQEKEQESGPPG